jgi:hypothetical protein
MTLHNSNLPPAEYLAPTVQAIRVEFAKFGGAVTSAREDLETLRRREAQARSADESAIAELARAGADFSEYSPPRSPNTRRTCVAPR